MSLLRRTGSLRSPREGNVLNRIAFFDGDLRRANRRWDFEPPGFVKKERAALELNKERLFGRTGIEWNGEFTRKSVAAIPADCAAPPGGALEHADPTRPPGQSGLQAMHGASGVAPQEKQSCLASAD